MLGRERLAHMPRGVQCRSLDCRDALRSAREVSRPPGSRVFLPATLGLGVSVIPPRPGPAPWIAGVTDGEDSVTAVQIDRHWGQGVSRQGCFPIGGGFIFDSGIHKWEEILPIVGKMG